MATIAHIDTTVLPGHVDRAVHAIVRDRTLQGYYVASGGHVGQRSAGANMSVDIDALNYYLAGVSSALGSTTNVTVAAAHATLPRIDVLYSASSGVFAIQQGTPTAVSPTGETVWQKFAFPRPPDMSGINGVILAEIYVPAAVTSIVDAYIRMLGCPFIAPVPTAQWEQAFILKEVATPASPASGYDDLYFKSDHKLYKKTAGGVETAIELAAGAGNVVGSGTPANGQHVVYDGITGLAIKPGNTAGTTIRPTGTATDTVDPTESAVRLLFDALRIKNHAWNSSFEFFLPGDAFCYGWKKLDASVTVAKDTGVRDGFGGANAIKITSAGSAKEGVSQTIKSLKASQIYTVRVWMKATTGQTAHAFTTGASSNLSITSTSTVGEWKTGTFTTDATPTDVVLKIGSDTNAQIVWFDCLSITEGAEIPAAYRKDPEWDSPKEIHFGKGDFSAAIAPGPMPDVWCMKDNFQIVGWRVLSDLSATLVVDIWKKAGSRPTVSDSLGATKISITAGTDVSSIPDWTVTEISIGDLLMANVDSNNNAKSIDVILIIRRR